MRTNVEARMAEPVTVVHRESQDEDLWTSTTYPRCFWRYVEARSYGADGTVAAADELEVQVPEDQGLGDAEAGDWLVRGTLLFEGTTAELRDALAGREARRLRSVDDRTGGLSGIAGPVARWASVTVLRGL